MSLPTRWPWLYRGFAWHVQRKVRKQFNVHFVEPATDLSAVHSRPLIVALNHPSWWDPLVMVVIEQHFSALRDRKGFAPIDADMLEKYAVFKRLGFFPVTPGTAQGARTFLRTGEAILTGDGAEHHTLWVTAQGRYASTRERPLDLMPGVARLAKRIPHCVVLPIAIDYEPAETPRFDINIAFGRLIEGAKAEEDLESELTRVLDDLSNKNG